MVFMEVAALPRSVAGPEGARWPALGLGTWRLGEMPRRAAAEVGLLVRALEVGYRLFDTAEMYGEGGAERVVGQALTAAFGKPGLLRSDVVIVSKVYPHHADAAGMVKACQSSLRRLNIDTIDLYLLHWRGDIELTETLKGFETLLRRGWIRYWGVSNFDLAEMRELDALGGVAGCAANQVYYSISERGIELNLMPWMRKHGMPLMAYSPIDGGSLSRHKGLSALGQPLGLSAAQLALTWVLEQPQVIAIPKAGTEHHLLDNWQCRDLSLAPETRRALDALFPQPKKSGRLAMR